MELIKTDTRCESLRVVREARVSNPDQGYQHRTRHLLRNRATLPSIIGIEAAVFLAILYTLARGPADLRQSSWVWVGLSALFLVLARLRRQATAWVLEEGRGPRG